MSIQALLEQVSRDHFPNPPATPAQLDDFERRVGWRLDPELRAFYLHCNGAELFERPNSPYRFLPLSGIIRARIAIRGRDEDSRGPASWYVLCDVGDGNYVLIDAGNSMNGRYPLMDGYREMFPDPEYCERIASSFSEFLDRTLASGGRHFWLEEQQSESTR
ncbi:SMI1/KNR4 family protein [Archangium lipolyticum]|uniref:SMI1/KNR4 family protein n=1 Tax=Archangium lipolyticum TaxID=2970465 RepID=UPI00214A0A53|nr:SMI1/KNR4 family protein [Archangium lipolyticum]